jgi:hypothetical protein
VNNQIDLLWVFLAGVIEARPMICVKRLITIIGEGIQDLLSHDGLLIDRAGVVMSRPVLFGNVHKSN